MKCQPGALNMGCAMDQGSSFQPIGDALHRVLAYDGNQRSAVLDEIKSFCTSIETFNLFCCLCNVNTGSWQLGKARPTS